MTKIISECDEHLSDLIVLGTTCAHDALEGGDQKLQPSVLVEKVISSLYTQMKFVCVARTESEFFPKVPDLLRLVGAQHKIVIIEYTGGVFVQCRFVRDNARQRRGIHRIAIC